MRDIHLQIILITKTVKGLYSSRTMDFSVKPDPLAGYVKEIAKRTIMKDQ